MSYLTRLSQQTGLAPAAPQIQPAELSPTGLLQAEEFVAPASPNLSPPSPSPRPATQDSEPSPFLGSQPPPQESAPLDSPQIFPPVQPGPDPSPDPSKQGLPTPHPENWQVTARGMTASAAPPEVVMDASPSVILPEATVERFQHRSLREAQAPAPETPPAETSPPTAMTYLPTLQTVRDWVSASPEKSRDTGTDTRAEAVPLAGLPQTVPTAPTTVQVINPADLANSPANRPNVGQVSPQWDMATNYTPFPASTTVISIGSIQVMVEGPPGPPAVAPARRSESPRPPARLSRHYLRLR